MQDQTLEDLVSSPNPLSSIITHSRKLSQYYSLFANPQQLKYYSQFPQIQSSLTTLQTQISNLVKDIGSFIGCQLPTKNNIKLSTTTEIIDQYVDNIEIKIKKFQEEEQKIRIKQKHPEKNVKEIKPQKQWNLKKPVKRVTQQKDFNFDSVNHQGGITPSGDINTTPFTYVETEAQFTALLATLSKQKEIAVDLQHSDKSYTGFTCLIQISTRTEDFIIDVFPLWSLIPNLNQIFNNPDIVKVFHGAYMDVKWLHRDFDIRITNLFDTFHASQHLKNQQNSYAYLLKHYCGVDTNKKYQMADWRERPLNEQMILYAKIDTHYLLEIFDRLKADIVQQAIDNKMDGREALNSVFANSKDVTQTLFNESSFKDSRHFEELMMRQRSSYSEKRCRVLERLFELRDEFAREEDQNSERLIPVKYLYELADKKEFIESQLMVMFRKNKEINVYVKRICAAMNEFLKNEQQTDNVNPQQKGIVSQKQTLVSLPDEQSKTSEVHIHKPMLVESNYEDFYFELDTNIKCSVKQYKGQTLKPQKTKTMLTFECPLNYQLKRFQNV